MSLRLVAVDSLIAFFAPLAALLLRDASVLAQSSQLSIAVYAFVSALVSVPFFQHFGIGRAMARFFSFHDAVQITKASAVSTAAAATLVFSLTRLDEIPRSVPFTQFIVLAIGSITSRLFWRMLAHQKELRAASNVRHDKERHIIIVGSGRLAWFYVRLLDTFASDNRKIVALLDEDKSTHGRAIYGHVIMGGINDAPALLDDFAQHGIYISGFVICERDNLRARDFCDRLRPMCEQRGLDLELAAEQLGIFDEPTVDDAAGANAPDADQDTRPRIKNYFRMKQPVEAAVAAGLLLALLPLCLLVALTVLASIGSPAIFWQRRVGKHGRPIYIYKFKTMRNPIDSEGRMLNEEERQSRIGRILRSTRLDELPQLYNIAIGEMAFIGPRPLLPVDQPAGSTIRLEVPPGLTGWAQIHGGQLVGVEEKNALDEWYVRNANLYLDLEIFVRTLLVAFTGDRRNERRMARALALTRRSNGARLTGRYDVAKTRASSTFSNKGRLRPAGEFGSKGCHIDDRVD